MINPDKTFNLGEYISETGETRVFIHRIKDDGHAVLADIAEWTEDGYVTSQTGIYGTDYIIDLLCDEEDPEDVPTFTFTPDW
tara:strand:- start:4633 stop:4878 length:246 start_codon:yes stop_codon:yes gene_type:complete